jgi:hypothetical protein
VSMSATVWPTRLATALSYWATNKLMQFFLGNSCYCMTPNIS